MEELFNIIVGALTLFYLVASVKKKRRQQAESGEEESEQRPFAPFGPFGPFEPLGPEPQETLGEPLPPQRPLPPRQAAQRAHTKAPTVRPAESAEELRESAGRTTTPYRELSTPFGEEVSAPFGKIPASFGEVSSPFNENSTPFGDRVAGIPGSAGSGRKPARKQARPASAKPAGKAPQQTADADGEETVQPAAEERHEAIRSFDPERAVIYAEILQPKFKEYE